MALKLPKKIKYPEIFKTSRETEVGIAAPTKTDLFTLREDLSTGDQPPVEEGETVIWIPGQGAYDVYDSSVNGSLWTLTANVRTAISETNDYIQLLGDEAASGFSGNLNLIDLPETANMTEISFRLVVHLDNQDGTADIRAMIGLFGTEVEIFRQTGAGTLNNDSIWTCIKKDNGDWELFDDGVLVDTVTPSDNILYYRVFSASGNHVGRTRTYQVSIDGRAYFIVGTSKGTYRLELDEV